MHFGRQFIKIDFVVYQKLIKEVRMTLSNKSTLWTLDLYIYTFIKAKYKICPVSHLHQVISSSKYAIAIPNC